MRLSEKEKIDFMAMTILFNPDKKYMLACKSKKEFKHIVNKVKNRIDQIGQNVLHKTK